MPSGGKRNGAGRPRGAINFTMRDILSAAAETGELPIAYMLRVMRDKDAPDARRDEMAKTAALYLHTKLTALPFDDALSLELGPVEQNGAQAPEELHDDIPIPQEKLNGAAAGEGNTEH